jgi:hypothetical protein
MKKAKQIKTKTDSYYDFIGISHGEIVNEMEVLRILNGFSAPQFSKMAGYSENYYGNLKRGVGRFSKKSYDRFMNIGLNSEQSELDMAIEICKKAGLKVTKLETITTWVEL